MEGPKDQIPHFDLGSFLQQDVRFHRWRRGGEEPAGLPGVLLEAGRIELENRDLGAGRFPDGFVICGRVGMAVGVQDIRDLGATLLREA